VGRVSDGLAISKDLTLPLDAVTQVLAFLGRRGSGKTYGASKTAECMLDAGAQVVVLDPVGVWWGLRLAANGKDAGIPVPVFGGLHGDVPLEPTAGALIADVVADRRLSVVIDVSQMIAAEQARFATALARQLFQRKKASPSALMLMLEECQEFIPQNPQQGEQHMLHEFQRMVKLGRNFGIGVTLISQRPQEVAKKVLNQTECLFAFQATGPHERKAIKEWVSEKGADDDLVAELPHFAVGECHVWSPQWLRISKTIRFGKKRTYDASSTPKVGAKPVTTRELAPVDLEALRAQMAATIEKARAEDPKLLQQRVRQLEAELRKAPARTVEKPVADPAAVAREVERQTARHAAATKRAVERGLAGVRASLTKSIPALRRASEQLAGAATSLEESLGAMNIRIVVDGARVTVEQESDDGKSWTQLADSDIGDEVQILAPERAPRSDRTVRAVAARPARELPTAAPTAEGVTPSMQRILDALAAFERLGISPVVRVNAAFFAGYTENGHFNNMLGALRTKGLIDYPQGGTIALTDAGRLAAHADAHPIDSLAALHDVWLSKVSPSEGKLLRALIDIYPKAIARADLAARAGYTENGHFNNMLGHLRTLGAADYPAGGMVAATGVLFPEGLA
jgi:hypothetical protein